MPITIFFGWMPIAAALAGVAGFLASAVMRRRSTLWPFLVELHSEGIRDAAMALLLVGFLGGACLRHAMDARLQVLLAAAVCVALVASFGMLGARSAVMRAARAA